MILNVLRCSLYASCFIIPHSTFIDATVLDAMIAEPPETAAEPVRDAITSGLIQLILAGRPAQAGICDIARSRFDRRIWLSERFIP